jgi:L,D-transpeptidase catalytic domain
MARARMAVGSRRLAHTGRARPARALMALILVICVALFGTAGALAGIALDQLRFGQPTPLTVRALATSTSTATPIAQLCDCTSTFTNMPRPKGGIPRINGQVILVSLSQQWLWAYQDQHLELASPVTTGMPQLPTPRGSYAVQRKEANVTFYSLWPPGSWFYYSPEHINYAMFFRDIGYYIHDAP